jgi:hypothetical protein
MHRGWDNTIVGSASISGQTLRVETNSRERADALRQRLEAACGERIRHRAREHADPLSAGPAQHRVRARACWARSGAAPARTSSYYADWLDRCRRWGNTARDGAHRTGACRRRL